MQLIYPAVIRKTKDGRFEARMVDLAGCAAAGDTIDEVLEEIHENFYTWVSVELEDNSTLPPVSDPEDIALGEDEFIRNICITYRLTDGWEE